jgi:hypothetical protein
MFQSEYINIVTLYMSIKLELHFIEILYTVESGTQRGPNTDL